MDGDYRDIRRYGIPIGKVWQSYKVYKGNMALWGLLREALRGNSDDMGAIW